MEHETLLSIVVPTKNRFHTLKSFIEMVLSFQNENMELVVQDNSDHNEELLALLAKPEYQNVVYHYESTPLSMNENSERAIRNSRGKYICFMGDDDLVSKNLYAFVCWMDKRGYDSAIFHKASYDWPGVDHKVHKFSSLIVPRFSGETREINVHQEYSHLLAIGGLDRLNMPQLYHGVILRERLEEIYKKTGTYFPGPSSDMAVSVALAHVVRRHVYCDAPLTSSGVSPKSAAGLGAKHQHEGTLKGKSFLPADVESVWEESIPKIWTGPTIWAESAIKAMRAMGAEKDLIHFNYSYFYAYFRIFCHKYRNLLAPLKTRGNGFNPIAYYGYLFSIFLMRCRRFLYNIVENRFHLFQTHIDNISNSYLAQKEIDRMIATLGAEWKTK